MKFSRKSELKNISTHYYLTEMDNSSPKGYFSILIPGGIWAVILLIFQSYSKQSKFYVCLPVWLFLEQPNAFEGFIQNLRELFSMHLPQMPSLGFRFCSELFSVAFCRSGFTCVNITCCNSPKLLQVLTMVTLLAYGMKIWFDPISC